MSLAENLLNSLDETAYENMRIAGSGEEEHIIVGQDRSITVPNALKTIAVKGDKDVETATIDCVRYWDGNDLSTFAIYLNYILPNGDEGTYIPKSITKSVDFFTFDWKIGSEFTYSQGKLTFWIVAKLTDNSGTLVRQWSSFQNSDCTIAQGGDKIYVPEKQTDQDVISQAISISRASAETAEQQANLAKEAAEKAATDAREAAEDEVSRIIGELGVVQELGDSPNSVVSQLKVTKEFNKTNAKINRNSKRITNLEQGLPAEMFETDSTMAYQKDVPENVLPYASINKIGGMTYKTENLIPFPYVFGNSTTNSGVTFSVGDNGSITVNGTPTGQIYRTLAIFTASNLLTGTYSAHIEPYNAVSLLIEAYNGTTWYKTLLQGDGTIEIDWNGYSEIRVMLYIYVGASFSNVTVYPMLNEGTTAKPYSPYFEGLRSAKVTAVKSVGVNLWDEQYTISPNGYLLSSYIPVTPNTKYYLNTKPKNGLYAYDKDKNTIKVVTYNAGAFTTPENAHYVAFRLGIDYGTEYKNDIILNASTTAKPYTPYVEHILPIPEELRPANGINAEVYDSIELNENGSVTKRVKCGVVDLGTLDWIAKGTSGGGVRFQGKVSPKPKYIDEYSIPNVICYKYKTVSTTDTWNNIDGVTTRTNDIEVKDSSYADAATFKAAMSGVMLVYELAEPIVTDISDLITADNLISVEGGGTLTFENEYGYAVPSEVEYQVEV